MLQSLQKKQKKQQKQNKKRPQKTNKQTNTQTNHQQQNTQKQQQHIVAPVYITDVHHRSTFKSKHSNEVYLTKKIFNFNSKMVIYLIECRVC